MAQTAVAPAGTSASRRWEDGLDEDEKYAFDTGGYVVLRQLLTPEEVNACNEAIDAMTVFDELVGSESYSGGSPLMRGRFNLFNRLVDPIMTLQPSAGAVHALDAVADALHAAAEAVPQVDRGTIALEDLRAVLNRFELDGWTLNTEQVEALIQTADELSREGFKPVVGKPHRVGEARDGLISVGCSNWRISGQLSWPQPHCEPFREFLCHRRLQPVLNTILGHGYRLDHGPCASRCIGYLACLLLYCRAFFTRDAVCADVAIMRDGCDGHNLHGGGYERFNESGFTEGYQASTHAYLRYCS
jgi:hypothetical protein